MHTTDKKNIIELTDLAVKHIEKIMQQRGRGKGFRLGVKASGCSGYKYHPEIVDEVDVNDIHFTMKQGLNVFIDPTCLKIINGTVIDIVSKGLGQEQLFFKNPNVESECGCGESFNLKGDNEQ